MGDKSENWCKFEPATTAEESNSFYIAECVQIEICFTGIQNLTFMNIKYELQQNTCVLTEKEIHTNNNFAECLQHYWS